MNRKYPIRFGIGILACFVYNIAAIEAIVGGDKALPDDFRYQVSLYVRGIGHNCGGGIIGDHLILTAAHCVVQRNGRFIIKNLTVIAGTHDLRRTNHLAVSVAVKKIYVPTEYSPFNFAGSADIAVLRLNHSLGLASNRYLQWLRLSRSTYEDYAGKWAIVTGFGWTWIRMEDGVESGGYNDMTLRYGISRVLNQTRCQQLHSGAKITDREMCAQMKQYDNPERPRGVCIGDSGGPLVYNGKTVIGVFSTGPPGCSEARNPAIYTRVSHYLTFIINAMNDKVTKYLRTKEIF